MIQIEASPFRPAQRSLSEIDRDEIVRQTLNELEGRIDGFNVNETYRAAFRVVTKIIRAMKP